MTQLRARIRTKLRRVVRRIVYFPLSPSVFKLYASLLRRIGAVRGRNSVGRSPERILISHLYCNLGDFILTIPLIDSLNKHFPSYAVDIAIDKKLAEFCKVIPGISGVYPFEPGISRVSPINPYLHVINQVKLYWKGLRHVRYSMCIVPRWGDDPFLSQHLAYLSSAPQRYGYSSSVDRGDSSRDSLLSKSSVGGSGEHEVLRELRLLKRLGVTSECISDSIVDQPGRTLQLLVSKNDKSPLISIIPGLPFILSRGNYAIIAPGSNQQQKNWPAVNFAKLICRLQKQYAIHFIVTGGANEVLLCDTVANASGGAAVSIAGMTQMVDLMRLLDNACLVVGNDSGAGHLSGALGVPTIVINSFPRSCTQEHPYSPQRFRPMGPRVTVLQPDRPLSPCTRTCEFAEAHCIKQVSVETVVATAEEYLDLYFLKR